MYFYLNYYTTLFSIFQGDFYKKLNIPMEVYCIEEQSIASNQKHLHTLFWSLATPKVKVATVFISNSALYYC